MVVVRKKKSYAVPPTSTSNLEYGPWSASPTSPVNSSQKRISSGGKNVDMTMNSSGQVAPPPPTFQDHAKVNTSMHLQAPQDPYLLNGPSGMNELAARSFGGSRDQHYSYPVHRRSVNEPPLPPSPQHNILQQIGGHADYPVDHMVGQYHDYDYGRPRSGQRNMYGGGLQGPPYDMQLPPQRDIPPQVDGYYYNDQQRMSGGNRGPPPPSQYHHMPPPPTSYSRQYANNQYY